MEDGERTKISCGRFLLLLSQGVILGIGAVLPGISGGVLCVIFGIYQPMMETLAHPKKGIKKYGHMVLPVVLGFLGGFVLLAGAIAKLASSEPAIVTSLFVGLIVGTLPQLFRDGAKQGRDKSCYIALAASTSLLLGFFMLLKYGTELHITPNAGWFFFCGALWGISMVAPGMTSSSVLMLLGLYYPMSEGIAALDMGGNYTVFAGHSNNRHCACQGSERFIQQILRHCVSLHNRFCYRLYGTHNTCVVREYVRTHLEHRSGYGGLRCGVLYIQDRWTKGVRNNWERPKGLSSECQKSG